jgi:Type VI secretion system/phage-baseplate injector OB domain
MAGRKRNWGKHRATVMDATDPLLQARLQVSVPEILGEAAVWAMPCLPFATSAGAGIIALPPPGTRVWVEFEAGDTARPVWTGCFWDIAGALPAGATAGATPAQPNVHLQTVGGVSLTLSDNPAEQVRIATPAGAAIAIGAAGITLTNGQGATIQLTGPSVVINGGAFVVT